MGRIPEVYLRSPSGELLSTAEAAKKLFMSVGAVRTHCWTHNECMGWKVERRVPDEAIKRKGPGYEEVTLSELYESWLWCRESPDMKRIIRDMAGTNDIDNILKVFERWHSLGRT